MYGAKSRLRVEDMGRFCVQDTCPEEVSMQSLISKCIKAPDIKLTRNNRNTDAWTQSQYQSYVYKPCKSLQHYIWLILNRNNRTAIARTSAKPFFEKLKNVPDAKAKPNPKSSAKAKVAAKKK